MNQLHPNQTKEQRYAPARNPLKRYLPLIATVAIATLPFMSGAEARRPGQQQGQCSASVQTGQIPSAVSRGANATVFNTPLVRASASYLSLTLPERYLGQVRTAASGRAEAERPGYVADILQNNIQVALARLGSSTSRVSFSCAPVDGSLPAQATGSAAPSASPSQSAAPRPSSSARPAPSAVPSATAQPSATAPQPSAQPARQDRGRTISP